MRTETQDQILAFLGANPESSTDQLVAGIDKTRNAIHASLRELQAKGLCERVQRVRYQWTYRSTIFVAQKPIYMGQLATGRVSGELVRLYKPAPWLSARTGADDHKRHTSMGALSHFKDQS